MTATNLGRVLVISDVCPARFAKPGDVVDRFLKIGPRFDNEFEPVFAEVAGGIWLAVNVQRVAKVEVPGVRDYTPAPVISGGRLFCKCIRVNCQLFFYL
jgi:hypothetical protein